MRFDEYRYYMATLNKSINKSQSHDTTKDNLRGKTPL